MIFANSAHLTINKIVSLTITYPPSELPLPCCTTKNTKFEIIKTDFLKYSVLFRSKRQ